MSPIQTILLLVLMYVIIRDVKTQSADTILSSNEIKTKKIVFLKRCKTDFGAKGLCVPLLSCEYAKDLILSGRSPTLCSHESLLNPIVCCKTINQLVEKFGSIAEQKCSEYILAVEMLTANTGLAEFQPSLEGTPPIIVDGVDASPTEFPHMAILGYGTEANIKWKCGGSLISEKFVLTAAHCIYAGLEKVAFVNLGVHDLSQNSSRVQKFTVKNTHQYPEYIPHKRYHDIAIIELNGKAIIKSNVKPACLQTKKEFENRTLSATGWGALEFGGKSDDVLQKVNLTRIPFDICTRSYQPQMRLEKGLIDDMHLCADSIQTRGDTCQGDSGGPLQFKINGSKLYTVVGVTSFGIKCGLLPSVYTRVSHYLSWIEGIVWPNDV